MVAALDLLERGDANKVGILDCDEHYGNGTDDIIDRCGLWDRVIHYTAGEHDHKADAFLAGLSSLMERTFAGCAVLLYQAGADPHIDDPLGGWMTTEQLRERDKIVFRTAKRMELPVAWCLAGGYQRDAGGGIRPVLAIHDGTMAECLAAQEEAHGVVTT